jgi:putative inorganic carbon (HCO3(-)) transporter
MRDVVIIVFAVFLIIAATTSRFMSAIGYWWFSIFRPQDWVWGNIHSLKLPLIALVLFVIPCFIQGLWPRTKDIMAKLMIFWLFLAVLATLTTSCNYLGFRDGQLQQVAILILAVLLTERVVDTPRKFYLIIVVIGGSLAFHAGKAGLQSLVGIGGTFYGAATMQGLFSGSNSFAFGSAVLLFYNLFLIRMAYDKKAIQFLPKKLQSDIFLKGIKYIGPIMCFGIIYNVISLFSRGSALAMFIGLMIWVVLSKLMKIQHILGFGLFVGIIIGTFGLPEGYSERLESSFAEKDDRDASAESRPHFWGIAYDMAADHPLGVGPGCYNSYYNNYDKTNGLYGRYRTVHSAHFEVLAEVGFLGILVWLLLFLISVKRLLRIRKEAKTDIYGDGSNYFYFSAANMLIVSNITFFIGSAFYAQAYNDIIWVTWGLTIILTELFQKHKANPCPLDTETIKK